MKRRHGFSQNGTGNNGNDNGCNNSPASPVASTMELLLLTTNDHHGRPDKDNADDHSDDDNNNKHPCYCHSQRRRFIVTACSTWKRSILMMFFWLLLCVYDRFIATTQQRQQLYHNRHLGRASGNVTHSVHSKGTKSCYGNKSTTISTTSTANTNVDTASQTFLSSLPIGKSWAERSSESAVLTSICPKCWETRDHTNGSLSSLTPQSCAVTMLHEYLPQTTPPDQPANRLLEAQHHAQLLQTLANLTLLSSSSSSLSPTFSYCQAACHSPAAAKNKYCHYWRHDAAGPVERYSRTHELSSIPNHYRLPSAAVDNLELYMQQQGADAHYPSKVYLFAYNPSLVVLPKPITTSSLGNNNHYDDEAIYLAAYRVTYFQYCFASKANVFLYNHHDHHHKPSRRPPPQQQRPHDHRNDTNTNKMPPVDGLVALALLRADLSVVADITVDVSNILRLQDPRLFVINNRLYLASFEAIVPFELVLVDTEATATTTTTTQPSKDHGSGDDHDHVLLYDYWNYTTTTANKDTRRHPLSFAVRIRRQASCAVSSPGGKNFNYFSVAGNSTTTDSEEVWVETNPLLPRRLERIDLQQPCRHGQSSSSLDKKKQQQPPEPIAVLEETKHAVRPSFETLDTLLFAIQPEQPSSRQQQRPDMGPPQGSLLLPYSANRGTACCVPVTTPTGQTWMMGISHTKSFRDPTNTVTGRQYFSRLYAFDSQNPARIVAMSGTFCMGLPTVLDISQNYLQAAAARQVFRVGPHAMACPKITFVSGLILAANDPSKVIISYGINDCTGRVVIVDKSDLWAMLMDPSSRMLIKTNDTIAT